MAGLLSQWIKDSEKFEMERSYHTATQDNFGFLNRQDDFYITLLNRMFFVLEEVEDGNYASRSKELMEVAKGLLIYSDKDSRDLFSGIDKCGNTLYVASVYYLIGYEAIASLLLRGLGIETISNKYGRAIAYIIGGRNEALPENVDEDELFLYQGIDTFISTGRDEVLGGFQAEIEKLAETMAFATLDEFFDCHMLKHVLRKFSLDNIWADLKKYAPDVEWNDYVDYSRTQGILQFLPSQRDAIEKGLLTYEHSFSLKMPTSSGKSYITELLIYKELQTNPKGKVLYLAPLRSLSYELSERYAEVGKALGFDSFAAYGGNSSTLDNDRLDETSLFITTPEFFVSMEGGDEELLGRFTLVICDEGQLLDSLTRGTNYELLLSRIKSRGVARFLFISAIIPNIEDVNTWLGGRTDEVGNSKYRPCEIKLAVAEKQNRNICLHVYEPDLKTVKFDIEAFLDRRENVNVAIGNKITKSVALGLKSVTAGSTLVFTYSKEGKYGCQRVCDKLMGVAAMHKYGERLIDDNNRVAIEKLHEYISYQYGADYPLSKYLSAGFAYHNGGLPQDVREYIEDYYRHRKLKILVSNSTLAEGVNLPIRTLVVYNLRHYNSRTRQLELIASTEIRNILGRVGRVGREKYGLVVLPDNNKEVFDTVVEALKGDGIHEIRGIFYEVIQMLRRNCEVLTDDLVNEVLMEIGASSAIDQMIYRHYGDAQEDVVENSISDSLAYHLSDDDSRTYIRRAFRVRKERISESINDEEQFNLLKASGLELEDFLKMEKMVKEDMLDTLITEDITDEEWLKNVAGLIYEMPTIESGYEYLPGDVKEVIEDKSELAKFICDWLRGKQYHEIAKEMNLAVDDMMDLLSHLQYHFYMRLQGLIRYLSAKYDFSDSGLTMLPEGIKHGICNDIHAMLIKGGLRDRIALHKLAEYIEREGIPYTSTRKVRSGLKARNEDFETYMNQNGLPQLTREKIRMWKG